MFAQVPLQNIVVFGRSIGSGPSVESQQAVSSSLITICTGFLASLNVNVSLTLTIYLITLSVLMFLSALN